MIMWFKHPRADLLAGFASRSLAADEQRAVGQHLETCVRCRETVVALRAVGDLANDAQPSDAVLERIIRSRSTGVRMVLPTEDVSVATTRRPGALVAGLATAAALLALFLIRGPGDASAGVRTGYLRLDPPRPVSGAVIHVSYTPSAALQGFDSLVLRARFRRPTDDAYNRGPMQTRAAVLHRTPGGDFTGQVRLPDSVVFGVFAIENPAGDAVDHNDQRLWDVLVHDASGRPLFDAFAQKEGDLMGRNWELTLENARQAVSRYPDAPQAWSNLASLERAVLGAEAADSLISGHRERFSQFHTRFKAQLHLTLDVVSGMLSYAITTDDPARRGRYWRDRLMTEFPDAPDVLFRRENGLDRKNAARYFAGVEPLWKAVLPTRDPVTRFFIGNALVIAREANDTSALRLWADRYKVYDRHDLGLAHYQAEMLMAYPTLRPLAMQWLRDEIRLLDQDPEAYRPLTSTRPEYRADNRAAAQPVLVKLADALVGDGDTVAALDTLRLAATYGWRPQVYDAAAAIWLSKGDTAQALRSYAKVAVDPASPPTYGDSIKAALALRLDGAAWTSWLKAAEDEMRGAVLARAAPRSLGVAVRLKTADGRILSLGDLSGGKVTLVTFWSRTCGPAVRQLPEIAAVASRVTRSGAAVVTVTKEPVTADLRAFLKARGAENLPVAFDYQNEARRAFGNFATPEFYVLDAAGRVVFAHTTLEAIPRQVAALLP